MLSELRDGYRRASGWAGPVVFVMHPDDLQGAVAAEAEAIGAHLMLDRECPPGRIYCKEAT